MVMGHCGTGRAQEHVRTQVALVEEPHEFLIVTPLVVDDESLELRLALAPACRARAEERLEVVEVSLFDRPTDLVAALEMPSEPEQGPKLVFHERLVGGDVAKRPHHVEMPRLGLAYAARVTPP